MEYKITVTKRAPRLEFNQEYAEYQKRSQYTGYNVSYPEKYENYDVLEVVLTEHQFAEVKRAVLENFAEGEYDERIQNAK